MIHDARPPVRVFSYPDATGPHGTLLLKMAHHRTSFSL